MRLLTDPWHDHWKVEPYDDDDAAAEAGYLLQCIGLYNAAVAEERSA